MPGQNLKTWLTTMAILHDYFFKKGGRCESLLDSIPGKE